MAHPYAVPYEFTEGSEAVDFACDENLEDEALLCGEFAVWHAINTNLEEVEREPHVPEHGGVVGAQCDGHAVVDERGERVHRHRGCQSLLYGTELVFGAVCDA